MKKIPLLLTPIFIFITTNIALAETIYSGKMLPMVGSAPTSSNSLVLLQAPLNVLNLKNLEFSPNNRYIVSDEFKLTDFTISNVTDSLLYSDLDGDEPQLDDGKLSPFTINIDSPNTSLSWIGNIPYFDRLLAGMPSTEPVELDADLWRYNDIYDGSFTGNVVKKTSWASRGVLSHGGVTATINVPVITDSKTGNPNFSEVVKSVKINVGIVRQGIDVNGVRFPFNSFVEGKSFPVTGSAGFYYDLVYEMSPEQYDWSITPNDGHVSIDTKRVATRVTLNSPPPPNTKYTIVATPKPGTNLPVRTHEFMLKKWFLDYGNRGNYFWQEALDFCSGLGSSYSVPSATDITFIQNLSEVISSEGATSIAYPSLGEGLDQYRGEKDAVDMTLRSNNFGAFFNEWGQVPKTRIAGFFNAFPKQVYWAREAIDDFRAISMSVWDGSESYSFKQGAKLPIMCMLDLSNPDRVANPEPKPVVTDLKIVGNFVKGSILRGQYTFDPNLGTTAPTTANQTDRSLFAWGTQGTTASAVVTTSNTNFVRTSGVIPDSPQLTAEDVGTVYELSVQPRNGLDVTGDVVTVDTSMQN